MTNPTELQKLISNVREHIQHEAYNDALSSLQELESALEGHVVLSREDWETISDVLSSIVQDAGGALHLLRHAEGGSDDGSS